MNRIVMSAMLLAVVMTTAACQTPTPLQVARKGTLRPGTLVDQRPAVEGARPVGESALGDDAGGDGADVLAGLDDRDRSFNRRIGQVLGREGGPEKVGRSEVKGEEVRLIEVETSSTVGSEDTRRQMKAFAGRPGAKVFLAVPYDSVEQAHKLRDDMEVEFSIIPCYPYVNSIGTPE